jgi:hypothetical protein
MKLKILIASVLIGMLLQVSLASAVGTSGGTTGGFVGGPPMSGGGSSCDCPEAGEIADTVIAKIKEETKTEIPQTIDYSELEKPIEKIKEKINITTFSGKAEEIIGQGQELLDTPLTEAPAGIGWLLDKLKYVGIDMSILTYREARQVGSCAVISAGGLWDYLSTLQDCVSNVIDAKLAKEAPERLAREQQEKNIESAYEATVIISKELVSNNTASLFGW